MVSFPLLPNRFKVLGWLFTAVFLPLLIFWLAAPEAAELSWLTYGSLTKIAEEGSLIFNLKYNNFTDEVIFSGLLLGLSLLAFSRRAIEDEGTLHLRLEAMLWSVWVNSILSLIFVLMTYSALFLYALMINLFSVLFFFIFRFEYTIWKAGR